jgi:curli biogenesis system outer membrane secretion channel CsgG
MKTKFYLIALVMVAFACTPNMKITYKVNSNQEKHDQKLASIILDIEEFKDTRKSVPENDVLYKKGNLYKKGGQITCINAEEYYWKETVMSQVTQLLVDHLKSTKSFKKIVRDKKDSADYYVTGSLSRFYGQQAFICRRCWGPIRSDWGIGFSRS